MSASAILAGGSETEAWVGVRRTLRTVEPWSNVAIDGTTQGLDEVFIEDLVGFV